MLPTLVIHPILRLHCLCLNFRPSSWGEQPPHLLLLSVPLQTLHQHAKYDFNGKITYIGENCFEFLVDVTKKLKSSVKSDSFHELY